MVSQDFEALVDRFQIHLLASSGGGVDMAVYARLITELSYVYLESANALGLELLSVLDERFMEVVPEVVTGVSHLFITLKRLGPGHMKFPFSV
jgi:hypothetical protein